MLSVDLAVDPDWDLTHPPTAQMMQETAEEGLIDGNLGGPPCSTVSRARFNTRAKGPRPLRTRGEYVWGLPNLRPFEQARVVEANTLFVNAVSYFEAVSLQDGVHLLEHPVDPGEHPYPSFFDTDLLKGMESRTGARRITFDQCCYGQKACKRTTLSSTVDGLVELVCTCPGVSDTHTGTALLRAGTSGGSSSPRPWSVTRLSFVVHSRSASSQPLLACFEKALGQEVLSGRAGGDQGLRLTR